MMPICPASGDRAAATGRRNRSAGGGKREKRGIGAQLWYQKKSNGCVSTAAGCVSTRNERRKIVAAGVGSGGPSYHARARAGTQGRLAPLRKTRLGACRTYTSGLNMAKAMGAPRVSGIHPP